MIKKIKAFIAVAALSGTVGANVHAEEIKVQQGDTLWGISQVYNTSVENIENWNKLSTDLVYPGEVLTIATEKQYTVQQDDTLSDVAEKYQVSVNQIKEWNKLNTDLVHTGLDLVIYDKLTDNVKTVGATKSKEDSQAENTVTPVAPLSKQEVSTSKNEGFINNQKNNPVKPVNGKGGSSHRISVKATAYTASCEGCSGKTATGVDLNDNPDVKVIAVDPSVIPLGSKVYVEGYGEAIAADTGGAIKGKRIDVFIPSKDKADDWGKKEVNVTIISQ